MNNSKATIWRPDLVYDNIETKEDIKETLKNDLVKIDYAKDSHFRDDDKERNHFIFEGFPKGRLQKKRKKK